MEKNIITISAQEMRQGRQHLAEDLKQRKISVKEITLAQLLLEEMFFRLKKGMDGGEDFSLRMGLRRRWGDTELWLMAKGAEYNPIPAVTEAPEDEPEEEAYRLAILKANRQKMNYVRKNGMNLVTIKVHELDSTKRQLMYTLGGMVLGCLCGLVMQACLGAEVIGLINESLISPVRNVFLNALHMMMAPVTFFGLILNKMGDKAKGAVECIDFLFRFVIVTLKVIVKAIPLVVFLSMASLLASTGLESLVTFSGLFGGLVLGVMVVWAVGALTVLLFGRISPLSMTRKIIGLSPLVFTVSSSHARLPFVLRFCEEKLGIDAKLAAFSIPVGVQLNKAGNCIFFSLVTLMLMGVYEIEMSGSLFITLWVSVCIMAIAKPPIPCGGIICIAYLFMVVGVPPEAISVILCVDPIAAMFNGVCNESANLATTFILARENGMLDEEKYFAAK